MARFRLCAVFFSLLCLAFLGIARAQPDEEFSVAGSAIVNAIIEDLAAASGKRGVNIVSTGSSRGLEALCGGELDLATASRKMSSDERADCDANEISFSEFLIGHHIVAFVAHHDTPTQCLQFDQLEDLLRPTASNQVKDWSFYSEESAELPLSVWLPGVDDLAYIIADSVIVGYGLRLDGQRYESADEAIAAVADTAGALALVPWSNELGSKGALKVLEVGDSEFGGCTPPSAENVESEGYAFALSLYVYVNRARLAGNVNLSDMMQFIVSGASSTVIEMAGANPPSGAIYELNAKILADADGAPGLTGDDEDFLIPFDLSGEIRIAGAANTHQTLSRTAEGLGAQLIVDQEFAGMLAGIGSLCQGEADIAALDGLAPANTMQACVENDIVTVPLHLGAQATVLLANAENEAAACLTTQQINAIWRADSAGSAKNWADIAGMYPDLPLTLFGLTSLDIYTDILLQTAGQVIPSVRRDTEQDYNPLYRAAAVGNVSGGLTYMSWPDFQDVLNNEQPNIQLVAVDGGSGCIEPSVSTIEDGVYPLSRRASLLVSEASLADVKVQAFLWSLYNEDNWTALQGDGFLAASLLELPIMRSDLLRRYAEAESLYRPIADEPDTEADNADEDSSG